MLQSRTVRRAELIEHLKKALSGENNHFFADTSFMLAAASLNPTARAELGRWIESLGTRFHVPAWAVHEIYGKITTSPELFAPMTKVASDAMTALEALQAEARRYIDNDRARDFWGRPDRVGLLADLDRAAQPLIAHATKLKLAKRTAEEAIDFLVDLVNRTVLPSDIYSGLPQLDADFAARVIGGQPPGFMDKKKAERTRQGDNRYGDLIIWREIVEFVRKTNLAGVVLLTNDNKQDWVYTPSAILDDQGRPLNNDAKRGFKIILPLPLLTHELRGAREGVELTIANLGMISQMLQPQLGIEAPNLFMAYQPVGAAAPPEPVQEEVEDELEPVDEGVAGDEPPAPAPTPPAADLPQLLAFLAGDDVEAAAAAAGSVRPLLVAGIGADLVPRVADALLVAAERGIEAAAILVREIVTETLPLEPSLRADLLSSMLASLYYTGAGLLRNRPLGAALPDLFSVQALPTLAPAVESLNRRLGPGRRRYLLTPDPAVPILSLSVPTDPDESGRQRLRGIYSGDIALHEDVAPDSDRSLTRLLGGVTEANGAALRRALAAYFRVPEAQLDLGLSRYETVGWDSLAGLVDWGVASGLQLR